MRHFQKNHMRIHEAYQFLLKRRMAQVRGRKEAENDGQLEQKCVNSCNVHCSYYAIRVICLFS